MSAPQDDLTPLFHDTIRRFLEQEVAPHYEAWEEAGEMPRLLWQQLGEAGLLGIDLPVELGGSDADFAIVQLALEEISRQGFGGLASAYNIHANIVMPYLLHIGTPAQRERWLPAMASGETIGAIAMTEPGAGSDLAAMKTRASRTESGWRLDGSKLFITNGQIADLVIVCAKTDPPPAPAASRCSWSIPPLPASPAASRSRRSASTPAIPPSCSSTTCACRKTPCSARRAPASPI